MMMKLCTWLILDKIGKRQHITKYPLATYFQDFVVQNKHSKLSNVKLIF